MFHFPPPRFSTEVDPHAPSEGAQIAKVARVMGKPFMPWQRYTVQGGTQLTAAGMYRYPLVVITVPRQSGKTTLTAPVQVHRIMTRPNVKAFFTAQTGKDAGSRMRDVIEAVTTSPIAPLFKPRYAAHGMGLSLANGSRLSTFAPGPSALHGETPHLVTLDEIWVHDQAAGAQLMGAIKPAQATLEGIAQVWAISTMGTAQSGFMNELVERGRAGDPGMFYVEWSARDGLDPYEAQGYWEFHPALGNTIGESHIREVMTTLSMGELVRAYQNRLTLVHDPLIAPEDVDALAGLPSERPRLTDLTITYEVSLNNARTDVIASWRDSTGAPCVRVIHSAPGSHWAHDYIVRLYQAWKPAALGADDGGPTRHLTDQLRRTLDGSFAHQPANWRTGAPASPSKITTVNGKDFGTACEAFLSYARDEKTLITDGSRTFREGFAHAVMRRTSDVVRFSRADSTGPIGSIIAGAIGLYLHDHKPRPLTAPVTKF